jgi:hypothetical protein
MAGWLSDHPGVTCSTAGADRWLVRAEDNAVLCDALAEAPRPTERVRIEVDPVDV